MFFLTKMYLLGTAHIHGVVVVACAIKSLNNWTCRKKVINPPYIPGGRAIECGRPGVGCNIGKGWG